MAKSSKLKDVLKAMGKTFHEVILDGIIKAIRPEKIKESFRPHDQEHSPTDKSRSRRPDGERYFHPSLYPLINDGRLASVTLASNCWHHDLYWDAAERKKAYMARILKSVDRDVHKDLMGRNFHKAHNYEDRLQGVFLFEKTTGNIHLHGIVNTNGHCPDDIARLFKSHWLLKMPSGDVDIGPVEDADVWTHYVTKSYREYAITKYYREDGIRALQGDDILYMPAVPVKD